jgi:hypothetical protein
VSPEAKVVAADESVDIEAEYTLECSANCPSCNSQVASLQVIRLLRTKVNFTSSLPRRGYAIVCPICRTIVPATIGGILG